MIDLIQITNDPSFAARCNAIPGMRLMVDLERLGKASRQAGLNTFISTHEMADVARIRAAAPSTPLMVRVNPVHAGSAAEIDAALQGGADLLMLPMFKSADTLRDFVRMVDGRKPVVPLLETAEALACIEDWTALPGLWEVYVGLNDLHLSLGLDFMFEPLARGDVQKVALCSRARGLRFGFGGIARLDEGMLPGRAVLAEHVRLGSQAVILSRTFHRSESEGSLESHVQALREAEQALAARTPAQVQADASDTAQRIAGIVHSLRARP